MSLPRVLITGATGFVGAHVLQQALEAGYPSERRTARPPKVNALRELYGGKVEVVAIEDVATGDFTEALKGVNAVIHVAAALPNKDDPAGVVRSAVDGSLNILTQAAAAGVKKFVLTSSQVTTIDANNMGALFTDYEFSEKDWNPATLEQALDGTRDANFVYCAAKTIAEQNVWKFADAHPEIDITTIDPPFIYGPFVPGTKADVTGTNGYFYAAVLPRTGGQPLGPQMPPPVPVDVRDVARAHVLALRATPTTAVGRKRLLVAGPTYSWKDAVEHLTAARPDLRARLPDASAAPRLTISRTDTSRARDVLGLTTYIDWRKTVEDTVESLLQAEKRGEI